MESSIFFMQTEQIKMDLVQSAPTINIETMVGVFN